MRPADPLEQAGGVMEGHMAQDAKQEEKLPVLSDDVIEQRLKAELPGWWYEGRWLRRKYNTDGWLTTLALVNTIGYLAEAAWHHPDLEVTWGKVWVKLRNHASNGITDRDFELAKRIEEVTLWKPAPGAPFEGTPNKWVRGGSPDKPA
jgi:4a-hydroxytetrahydrobiopterin dehydratase